MAQRRAAQPPAPYAGAYEGVRPSAHCDFNLGEAIMRCIASPAETTSERIPEFCGYDRGFNSSALEISGTR